MANLGQVYRVDANPLFVVQCQTRAPQILLENPSYSWAWDVANTFTAALPICVILMYILRNKQLLA